VTRRHGRWGAVALGSWAALAVPLSCSSRRAAEAERASVAAPVAAHDGVSARAPGAAQTPAPTSEPAPALPTHIAGPAAFDLALAAGGALLAWSPPRARGGGLFVQRLDARGTPREPALRLAQTDAGGEVVELAATTLGARVGAAWIESGTDESRTRALLLTPGEPSPPEPARLALGEGRLLPGRSRLAVGGGRAGRLRVLHGRSVESCGRGSSEPCVGYSFSELGEPGDQPPRGASGEWLRVPSPCPDVPPLLGGSGSALYYAVCAEGERERTTTAYGVDMQSEYAHAVEVLAGCTPTALLSPLRGGAWVVGRCADGVRAAELGLDAAQGVKEHALDDLEAVCVDAVITLRAGALELPLVQPLDGLEALLPATLAPAGASAVFTGSAIVVVRAQAGELSLGRYACEGGAPAPSRF
jgi:hypothetical protein